jgi:hypothetical protein
MGNVGNASTEYKDRNLEPKSFVHRGQVADTFLRLKTIVCPASSLLEFL